MRDHANQVTFRTSKLCKICGILLNASSSLVELQGSPGPGCGGMGTAELSAPDGSLWSFSRPPAHSFFPCWAGWVQASLDPKLAVWLTLCPLQANRPGRIDQCWEMDQSISRCIYRRLLLSEGCSGSIFEEHKQLVLP